MHSIGFGTNEDIKNGTPPNIDILLVEQEVAASDEITALQMVVAADTVRAKLMDEAKELEQKLEEGGLKYCPVDKLDAVVEGSPAGGQGGWAGMLRAQPQRLSFSPAARQRLLLGPGEPRCTRAIGVLRGCRLSVRPCP